MLTNTATRYGALARFFHWAIALLILIDIGLGLAGGSLPRNADTVATLKTLYSIHKTLGVTVLGLAILRVLWAVTQPRPVPVHPDRKAESFVAELVHWVLYGAIFVMPLSGWIMHAAESGFAPILWPFGQGLPFVPKSDDVAHMAGAVHGASAWVIYITVGLHVLGALKHAVVDRDGVLSRMLRGTSAGVPEAHVGSPLFHVVAGLLAFVLLWGAVVIGAVLSVSQPKEAPAAAVLAETAPSSEAAAKPVWTVAEGSLGITVQQMGAPVSGSFGSWDAQIAYDPETGAGQVTVQIDTTSLTLGSVTQQALGPEFFNTESFATARFAGPISRQGSGPDHQVAGTLTLVGQEVPVTLDFTLELDGDSAHVVGQTTLDRRDFGMGAGYEDESTVGYAVDVSIDVTATRADP
nr:cytochrome b/b6 domain-containing protein [uncultured Celeribacter sp.]